MFEHILMGAAFLFLVLGAADYATGNRFGLGKEFEQGILSSGRLLLCMAGFLVLAPVLARGLTPILAPALRMIYADPSLFAGSILAGDSGGAILAAEMADNPQAGAFNGLVVGSMLGVTIMFNIPMVLQFISLEHRDTGIYGLLVGIITIPVGCIAGGVAGSFAPSVIVGNTTPVLVISLALAAALIKVPMKTARLFQLLGNGVVAVSIFGLVCGGADWLLGIKLISGIAPIEDAFTIVGGICIFLAGMFSCVAVIRRLLRTQFAQIGNRFCIQDNSVGGLLSSLVNGLPALSQLDRMDPLGRMLNTAFLVSGSCVFGDHLAYAAQAAPDMLFPLIVGKLAAGLSSLVLTLLLTQKGIFFCSDKTKIQ